MGTQSSGTTWFGTGLRIGGLRIGALIAAIAFTGLIGSAQATFHLIKIAEIFPGTAASPNAQYIVLQMYANGENLVANHNFTYYNASGQVIGSFTFQSNVANGANQAKILIATPEARTFFNVVPDFTTSPQLMRAGGKICYADTIDCVAWGNYTGSTEGVGTPFNATGGGLVSGRAVVRRLDVFAGSGGDGYGGGVPGSTTTLEGQDDTNNCANDFRFGTPAPKNNAGQVGHVPTATCGNGKVEGLEQCDDGNRSNGDRCNSVCSAVTTPTYRAYADFNADLISDVPWRNPVSGTFSVWRSAVPSFIVSGNLSPAFTIAGVGDFNGDGRADFLWRSTSGYNTVWRSGSSASVLPVAALNVQWTVAGIGDFDGDRRADILWRNGTTGANVIWRSANAAAAMAVSTVGTNWRVAGVGDFNGDVRSDILWRSTSGANIIWRSGSSSLPTNVSTVGTAWSVAGIGDFDADGRSDILWRSTSGANAIWRSGSSATATPVSGVATSWRVAAVGDYNGDRRSDILWRSTGGSNVIWRSGLSGNQQAMSFVAQPWTIAR
ncbi:MAG: hypothetical protein HOQ01_09145 [Lysobacter sp.]|nr:hypothetical protein [Lysobacter sp.]